VVQVVLKRALQDVMGQLPGIEVAISLPAIKASLSDYEYLLITSVAQANIGEVRPASAMYPSSPFVNNAEEFAQAKSQLILHDQPQRQLQIV